MYFYVSFINGYLFDLSPWDCIFYRFTCNPERQFEIFLDGKAHVQFSHRVKNSLKMASSKKKEEKEISEEGKSEL